MKYIRNITHLLKNNVHAAFALSMNAFAQSINLSQFTFITTWHFTKFPAYKHCQVRDKNCISCQRWRKTWLSQTFFVQFYQKSFLILSVFLCLYLMRYTSVYLQNFTISRSKTAQSTITSLSQVHKHLVTYKPVALHLLR